ncbi:glycosyltransferase [Pedobacter antarcticus]|uniref:glycosyltransferase n=1 Tax=Pedobacter antarcticus TaxID=34086 RepID=UPI002931CA0B|nr:glycosyltransferase [Pedobacter antarcticus]
MKAAFIHDHKFIYNSTENLYYDGSGGVFGTHLWSRYLEMFEKLYVVGREANRVTNKMVLSSYQNVEFRLMGDLVSGKDRILKAGIIKKKLYSVISEIDVAVIRLPSVLGYFSIEICRELGKKYVLEIVGCPFDAYWNYGGVLAKITAPVEYMKLKSVAKKSDAVVYVTKDFLQERYPTNGNSIGISNVNLQECITEEAALSFFSDYSEDQPFNVGMIGSFHVKYKGHTDALHALKRIIDSGSIKNIKFYFVGTGDAKWLIDLINELGLSEYVNIVGTLDAGKDGIIPFLDKMHLYIHPSKTEGLPRVVIEALSRGRLCIASSVGGIPELLKTKYLHSPGNSEELSNKIIDLYLDRNSWSEIVKYNLKTSEGYFELLLQEKRKHFITTYLGEN